MVMRSRGIEMTLVNGEVTWEKGAFDGRGGRAGTALWIVRLLYCFSAKRKEPDMKQTLSIAFALALAGALLTGCDRPADKAGAGTGGTSAGQSSSGSASGSAGAGGTAGQSTEKKKAPSSPTPPPSN